MARTLSLRREAAWAGAVCYTLSGYFLSHLSFYNLIAGATLAPAFVAACLTLLVRERRRWALPAVALLWGLLLLGGDPLKALPALLLPRLALLLRLGGGAARSAPLPTGASGVAILVPGLAAWLPAPSWRRPRSSSSCASCRSPSAATGAIRPRWRRWRA